MRHTESLPKHENNAVADVCRTAIGTGTTTETVVVVGMVEGEVGTVEAEVARRMATGQGKLATPPSTPAAQPATGATRTA